MFLLLTVGMILKAGTTETNETFNNASATIHWAFSSSSSVAPSVSPEGAFTLLTVANGTSLAEKEAEVASAGSNSGISFVKYEVKTKQSRREATSYLEWKVKPKKGLTFTPTKVSAHIARFGTDGVLLM